MLCQNCGENEVNFKYTQVINGVKKEIALCSKCARELGLEELDFSMPINFSSFLGDFLSEYANSAFLPSFDKTQELQCKKCGTTFADFVNSGELGCSYCYDIFADRISPVLKNLHGSSTHIGRGYKESVEEFAEKRKAYSKENKKDNTTNNGKSTNSKTKQETKLDKLQKELQKAIKDERYEEAAKIRDEIKKIK